ncbi:MAG: hypothetical protein WCQ60_01335 [bacterium]
MRKIEQHIQDYIDKSVERVAEKAAEKAAQKAEVRFCKRTERYMKEPRDDFREEIKMGFEAYSDRPTKEQVREIVREEIQPIHRDMLIFKEEMRVLRLDYNKHDKRITKLELHTA